MVRARQCWGHLCTYGDILGYCPPNRRTQTLNPDPVSIRRCLSVLWFRAKNRDVVNAWKQLPVGYRIYTLRHTSAGSISTLPTLEAVLNGDDQDALQDILSK